MSLYFVVLNQFKKSEKEKNSQAIIFQRPSSTKTECTSVMVNFNFQFYKILEFKEAFRRSLLNCLKH